MERAILYLFQKFEEVRNTPQAGLVVVGYSPENDLLQIYPTNTPGLQFWTTLLPPELGKNYTTNPKLPSFPVYSDATINGIIGLKNFFLVVGEVVNERDRNRQYKQYPEVTNIISYLEQKEKEILGEEISLHARKGEFEVFFPKQEEVCLPPRQRQIIREPNLDFSMNGFLQLKNEKGLPIFTPETLQEFLSYSLYRNGILTPERKILDFNRKEKIPKSLEILTAIRIHGVDVMRKLFLYQAWETRQEIILHSPGMRSSHLLHLANIESMLHVPELTESVVPCPKCGSKNNKSMDIIDRALDEAQPTIYICGNVHCGRRWKISA